MSATYDLLSFPRVFVRSGKEYERLSDSGFAMECDVPRISNREQKEKKTNLFFSFLGGIIQNVIGG